MKLSRLFERRWACARACYPIPEPQSFLRAFFQCIADGGELVYMA